MTCDPPALRRLTSRQVEILQAVAEGQTSREIGANCAISMIAARDHVARVLGKLEARNRAHAVHLAHQARLLSGDLVFAKIDLPQRHIEIVTMMANGMANRQISRAMCLSTETVRTNVKDLYRRIGARNRANAVHLAHLLYLRADALNAYPEGEAS